MKSEVTQSCPTLCDPMDWGLPGFSVHGIFQKDAPLNNRKGLTYAMANSDMHSTFFLGATAHLTNKTIIKITEKNDEPIWTEKWPLRKKNYQLIKNL